MAINFVKNDDIRILRDIEQYYSTQIDEMPMNGKLLVLLGAVGGAFLLGIRRWCVALLTCLSSPSVADLI